MPVNISGIHWALLAAHVPTCTVFMVDSLSMSSGPKYLEKWRYAGSYVQLLPSCYDTVTVLCILHFYKFITDLV